MHYTARITQEGRRWLAEFIDAPGCQTFAESEKGLHAAAQEALEGWLEAHLLDGDAPPPPKKIRARPGVWLVEVDTPLAVAIQLRWARQAAGLTLAQLAKRALVTQQQIARLERPRSNATLDTLGKVARALGMTLGIDFSERKRRAA